MPVYAELSENEIPVEPGGEQAVFLNVRNTGDTTDSFVVIAVGLCAGWTLIDPPTLTLFAGEQRTVRITLRPPRASSVTAGATQLTLRVVPHNQPDDTISIDATIDVAPFTDREITVVQPVVRARIGTSVDVLIENRGNHHSGAKLTVVDGTNRVRGRFEPPSLGIDPGQSGLTRLHLRPQRLRWLGSAVPIPYAVHVAEEGESGVNETATLLQAPILTGRPWARLAAALAILAGLAAAWFWLVRPAIDGAADDAVAEQVASAPTPTQAPGSNDQEDTPVTVVTVDGGQPEGDAYAFRLPVSAPVGQTGSQEYTVPQGQTLQITDIVLQNPSSDIGTATLTRNGDAVLVWNLANVFGDDLKQFVTPIELKAGDRLALGVTCTGAGDPAAGVCTTSASFSGRLVGA